MAGPVTFPGAEFEDLLLERGVAPPPASIAKAPRLQGALDRWLLTTPPLAPSLVSTVPVFLYPSVGGAADLVLIAMAVGASWLASAAGRMSLDATRGPTLPFGLTEGIVGITLAMLLSMLLGFSIGSGVPVLLALLFSLEAMHARPDLPNLTTRLALLAAAMVVRLDIGMSALQIEHGPLPMLLVLLLAAFEGLVSHRAERAKVVQTEVGPALAPGLAVLDLLLTGLATLSTTIFLVTLTQEPLIRGLAGGTVLLALPGFVLTLSCRLLAAWKVSSEPLPSLLRDHGALAGIVATALGLTIGAELLGS